MINKIGTTIFSLVFVCGIAQKKRPETGSKPESLSKIDSISQARWNTTNIDLDSLANPVIEKISPKFQDTIIIKKENVPLVVQQEMPLTPYNLIGGEEQRWFVFGQNNLTFNQASFNNWIAGGDSNVGVLAKVNYNFIYKYRKHYLENIVTMGYGFVSTEKQHPRKTEDYMSLMSNYGYELGKNYYLSTGLQFRTQFMPGYNYSVTPDPFYDDRISKFMAPGYLNLGVGISYNPKPNFQIILRPISGKFTFVLDPLLQKAGNLGLEHDGQSVRAEIGALMNVLYRLTIFKGITFDNQLNLFTNYAKNTKDIDVAYNGTLNIKFNKFISTTVSIDLIYDQDQIAKLQRKQTLGVGLAYTLGQSVDKEKSSKILKPVGAK